MVSDFHEWFVRNWDVMMDILYWAVTVLMGLVLISKTYKLVRMEFEFVDIAGLILAALWFGATIIFGFDDIRIYLHGFL